jgi:hypothetical protein
MGIVEFLRTIPPFKFLLVTQMATKSVTNRIKEDQIAPTLARSNRSILKIQKKRMLQRSAKPFADPKNPLSSRNPHHLQNPLTSSREFVHS